MCLKMNGIYLFFFAHLFDKIKCFFVKLKNRARVNDLKVTENSRNFFKHGFVKTKVFVLVTAPVGVVVAEDAFSVNATASTQKNNLPTVLFINNTVSLHTLFPAQKKHPHKRGCKKGVKSPVPFSLVLIEGAAYRRPSGRMVTNCHKVCYHKFRFMSTAINYCIIYV